MGWKSDACRQGLCWTHTHMSWIILFPGVSFLMICFGISSLPIQVLIALKVIVCPIWIYISQNWPKLIKSIAYQSENRETEQIIGRLSFYGSYSSRNCRYGSGASAGLFLSNIHPNVPDSIEYGI